MNEQLSAGSSKERPLLDVIREIRDKLGVIAPNDFKKPEGDKLRAVESAWTLADNVIFAADRSAAFGTPQPASKPLAYLKEWESEGEKRLRVDLHPECEKWLTHYRPIVTPLYARASDETPALLAIAETALPVHERVRAYARKAAGETSTQLTEAETLLQAWADPLPPNGKLYWEHVNKARQYFKDRPQRRPDTDIQKSSVSKAETPVVHSDVCHSKFGNNACSCGAEKLAAQETPARLTDDSEPASIDWRSQQGAQPCIFRSGCLDIGMCSREGRCCARDKANAVSLECAQITRKAVDEIRAAEKASERQPCKHGNATGHCQHCLDAL